MYLIKNKNHSIIAPSSDINNRTLETSGVIKSPKVEIKILIIIGDMQFCGGGNRYTDK